MSGRLLGFEYSGSWATGNPPKDTQAAALSLGLAVSLSLPAASQAQWIPTAGGSFDFNDTANWTAAAIDGVFSSTLTGDQTITFGTNTTLPNTSTTATTTVLDFASTGGFNQTFQSTDSVTRVLTMGATSGERRITSANATANRTITFADSVTLDFGSAGSLRRITSGNNTQLDFASQLTGSGPILFSTGTTNSSITLNNGTSDFTGDVLLGIARNLRVASIGNTGVASAMGGGSAIRFLNGTSATTLEYFGAAASTNRTFQLEANGATGVAGLSNTGTGTLTLEGNIIRASTNSGTDAGLAFGGTQSIVVNGTIGDSTGAGSLNLQKIDANTVTLNATDNAFSGKIDVRGGQIDFASVADSGTNSALGSGGEVRMGFGTNSATIRHTGSSTSTSNRAIALGGSSGGATILNDGSGALQLTNTAAIDVTGGAKTLTLGGTNTGDNLLAGELGNGSFGAVSVAKTGVGKWILSGNNTYTGTTLVSSGTLLISGSQTGTGLVTVDSGAAIGGGGGVAGDLTLASGADFVFSLTDTLTVSGSVTLNSTFGVANLLGLDNTVANGTYTLINGTATDFAALGIQNWGTGNAFDLGAGKSAYFQQGSLQLVVIPEPGAATLLLLGSALLLMRRSLLRR